GSSWATAPLGSVAAHRARLTLVPLHDLGPDLGTVDVTVSIGGHTLGRARPGRLIDWIRNECRHRPVASTPDADPALPAVVVARHGFRLRVGHVDDVPRV